MTAIIWVLANWKLILGGLVLLAIAATIGTLLIQRDIARGNAAEAEAKLMVVEEINRRNAESFKRITAIEAEDRAVAERRLAQAEADRNTFSKIALEILNAPASYNGPAARILTDGIECLRAIDAHRRNGSVGAAPECRLADMP